MEAFEAVDGDEDLFVVIVVDEEGALKQETEDDSKPRNQVIRVKKEFTEVDEDPGPIEYLEPDFEDLLKTAEENGDIIPIENKNTKKGKKKGKKKKQEKKSAIQEAVKEEVFLPLANVKYEVDVKVEPQDDEHLEAEFIEGDSDEEYEPESDGDYSESEEITEVTKQHKRHYVSAADTEKHRYKLRGADEQVSFVKQLCEQYPELAEDNEMLIETLCQCMVQTKPPDPPRDFFLINNEDYECVTCGAQKYTLPAMTRHWQDKHGPRYLVCYACGVDFRSKTNLYKHEKRCNSVDAVVVLKARARFVGSKGRSRPFLLPPHLLNVRRMVYRARAPVEPVEPVSYACAQCPARFSSKHALQSHEYAHRGARPFRCDQCTYAYTSKTALTRHRRAKHNNEVFICDTCKRSFNCKSSLVQHLPVHQPVRKYECSFCGRRFAQNQALKLHVDKVHFNLPPPCACQVCPKRYPRMNLLKAHMLRAHGMTLITRNMFYKTLPKLSDTQIKEAKVVLKSDNQQQSDLDLLDFLTKQADTEEITSDL